MIDKPTTFAERLKAARLKNNLSQAELAIRVGVVQSAISQFEAGSSTPRLETLVRIASSLGVSTTMLVDSDAADAADAATPPN